MSADPAPPPDPYPFDFRKLVVQELEGFGLGLREWRDGGVVIERDDGSEQLVGLVNLYRSVTAAPPESAADLVRGFFQNARVGNPEELQALPTTMEDAADKLMVRLGRPFADSDKAPWGITVPGVDDLAVHLVIDLPTMMAFVPGDMMAASATPAEDWLFRGFQNLAERTPADWFRLAQEEHGIWVGNTGDSYDAARALVLCDLTQSDELGWLVTIPARDWLFARKVEPAGLQFFHMLKLIANQVFAEQPYPISDEVYWVRPGKPWERFRVEFDGEKVTVYPSAEFAELLNLQVEGGEGEQPT